MFALYLQHLGETSKSHSAVSDAINAVAWVQRMAGVKIVAQNDLIRSISFRAGGATSCSAATEQPRPAGKIIQMPWEMAIRKSQGWIHQRIS